MTPRKALKLAAVLAGAVGLVSSFAVLAYAAPSTVHQGASASAYCFPSDKANRKQARDAAEQASASAAQVLADANAGVTKRRKALAALIAAQKVAKTAYYKTHKRAAQRAAFVEAQKKALAKAEAALKKAQEIASNARSAAASAASAASSAQAAYGQCS